MGKIVNEFSNENSKLRTLIKIKNNTYIWPCNGGVFCNFPYINKIMAWVARQEIKVIKFLVDQTIQNHSRNVYCLSLLCSIHTRPVSLHARPMFSSLLINALHFISLSLSVHILETTPPLQTQNTNTSLLKNFISIFLLLIISI